MQDSNYISHTYVAMVILFKIYESVFVNVQLDCQKKITIYHIENVSPEKYVRVMLNRAA